MGAHAKLSASGTKRWMNCAGSVELTDRLPKSMVRQSGEAARLGTAAHGLGEYCLNAGMPSSRPLRGCWMVLDADEDARLIPSLKYDAKEGWVEERVRKDRANVHVYEIDDDMADAVDLYIDVCAQIRELAGPVSEAMIEKRFNLSWLKPNMFGTGDYAVFQFLGRLYIIDYKHGQGVPVEITDEHGDPNTQLMYYLLGLAHEVEWLFEDAEIIIVQPRCPHPDGPVRRRVITKEELRNYMRELAAAVDMVEAARAKPEDHLAAGEWCRFCPLGVNCPELTRHVQETCGMDFDDLPDDLPVLAPDPAAEDLEEYLRQLRRVLEWKPMIDSYLRSADALAARLLQQGFDGERVGQKMVRGRAYRKFSIPEQQVIAKVKALGIAEDELFTPRKFKSVAQIEKVSPEAKKLVQGVRNKKHDPGDPASSEWLVEPIAEKGVGKLTMVPLSDPRPAEHVDPSDDFDDLPDEDATEV